MYISAYAFFQLPHGLFAVSLMTTFAPELASAGARNDLAALRAQLSRGLRLVTVVIVPAAAVYVGLGRPIVGALLQRGAFSGSDASIVAETLVAFAVGLLPFSAYLFLMRAFYSRQDTFTPFWLNCVENLVNIALAFPLYAWLGIPGLAWSFSAAYLVAAVLTLIVLSRRIGGADGKRLAATTARTLAAGLAVAGVAWSAAHLIGWTGTGASIAAVAAGLVVGGVVYVGLLLLLRVDELRMLTALLPGRRGERV